jgi:hypothetical protein
MNSLLSTGYWPNIHYFYYVFNSDKISIEQFENYQKQSFRNRTRILSANGPLDLSIPVIKKAPKELTKDVEISYTENWQSKHWRAITSAYKNSPYFEHFESEIQSLYKTEHEGLLEFNLKQLTQILSILRIKKDVSLSSSYEKDNIGFLDLRGSIHPKLDPDKDILVQETLSKPYYQTFEAKFPFIPNMSILDLLFNKGLETLDHLKA